MKVKQIEIDISHIHAQPNIIPVLIGPLGTNCSEILIKIHTSSFKKMHDKMAAILCRPQCVKPWHTNGSFAIHMNNSYRSFSDDALWLNFISLAPGRHRCHFKTAIFNEVLLIGIFTSSKDNALRWMPWDLTNDKSTLVQVMAWWSQATSHYLSQCWPSSV